MCSFFFLQNNRLWGSEGEVKSLWSIYVGPHTHYKGGNRGLRRRNLKLIFKNRQSSNWGLKVTPMKLESLVIVN